MPDAKEVSLCPSCAETLIPGKSYCPGCGLGIVGGSQKVAIDSYIAAKTEQLLRARVIDQATLVREIGDKAEDVVWARLKRYTWIAALGSFALGIYGISSIRDAKSKIVDEARARINPLISETEVRVKNAREQVDNATRTINEVNTRLKQTSDLAIAQQKRITDEGGEIAAKLKDVQEAANRANAMSHDFQLRAGQYEGQMIDSRRNAEAYAKQLDDLQRSLEARVDRISAQVNDVTIAEVYGDIDEKRYPTLNGKRWRGAAGKKVGEKWVAVALGAEALANNTVSSSQLKMVLEGLKRNGYVPLLGNFGMGGPVRTGFNAFSDGTTGVFYFRREKQSEAERLAKLASQLLNIPNMKAKLYVPAPSNTWEIETLAASGLDESLYVSR